MNNKHMYNDYRVKQLVNDTLEKVVHAARKTLVKMEKESMQSDIEDLLDDFEVGDEFGLYEEEDVSDVDGDCGLQLEEGDLARAHWIQLHKINKQGIVIQNAFIHILQKYKHLRPIWQFGRTIEDKSKEWKSKLYEDFYFRHHCASIQAALTMVMENKDDPIGMKKLLNEIGAHHFFYDACEPHLEVFQEGLIESMKYVLSGINSLDEATEKSWRKLLDEIKKYIGEGIAIQRNSYLRQCMTVTEMDGVRGNWDIIKEYGLQEAGEIICETAIKTYTDLLRRHSLIMPIPEIIKGTPVFKKVSEMIVMALDRTINAYDEGKGFVSLIDEMKDFVITCMVLEVCPSLLRKAFMEGLITMLSKVLGEKEINEAFIQIWSKIYRVLEQATIANIVDY